MSTSIDSTTQKPSGDGWLEGPAGEMRWGLYGAAGAFIFNPTTQRVLLQERALWTAQGGTWGIPGGAINGDETALAGALRETEEETGLPAHLVRVHAEYKVDLGWWSYTTFIGFVDEELTPVLDEESAALEWIHLDDVTKLPLHSAFAEAFPKLLALI